MVRMDRQHRQLAAVDDIAAAEDRARIYRLRIHLLSERSVRGSKH